MNENLFIHQSLIYDIYFHVLIVLRIVDHKRDDTIFGLIVIYSDAYYVQTQTCLLYQEKCGLGQLVIDDAQTASVISLNYENPSINE